MKQYAKEAEALISGNDLIKVYSAQTYDLHMEYQARNLVRFGIYADIFGRMEQMSRDELKIKFRQFRRYAAARPLGADAT